MSLRSRSRRDPILGAACLVIFACTPSPDPHASQGSGAAEQLPGPGAKPAAGRAPGQAPGQTPGQTSGHAAGQAGEGANRNAPAGALAADRLTVDAAQGPRDGNGLIAGERARIGLHITGGRPPYRIHLRAERQGHPLQPEQVPPLDARITPSLPAGTSGPSGGPSYPPSGGSSHPSSGGPTAQAGAREIALQALLDARAPSGIYRVRATVYDRYQAQATAVSEDIPIIGSDAPVRPASSTEPFVEVLDLARRRRRAFVRGERVAIHARLPGAGAMAELAIVHAGPGTESGTGPVTNAESGFAYARLGGAVLLHATGRPVSADGDLLVPLDIPRLARPGDYHVWVAAARDTHAAGTRTPSAGTRAIIATGTLRVAGAPFPPVERLTVDDLSIHGGADGRSRRTGRLQRGERLQIEARVGGARAQVTGVVRLRAPNGGLVAESPMGQGPIEITAPAPDARVLLAGTWTVPVSIPPGRYQLQVEIMEGDHVSARYRDVLVE